MKTLSVLDKNDRVRMLDWCRPLSHFPGESLESTKSSYGGMPINNFAWVRVHLVLGEVWEGKTVKEISEKVLPYEFVRGDVPERSKLKLEKPKNKGECECL